MKYYSKLPWLSLGPLRVGHKEATNVGVCEGNFNLEDGVCKLTYTLGSTMTTPSDSDGGGLTEYLDRHTLNCGSNGLNQFQLTRPSPSTLSYRYRCLNGIDSSANIRKTTPQGVRDDGNVIYLDKHNVDCGTNPISKFRLTSPENATKLSYDYTCNSKAVAGECRNVTTPWRDEDWQNYVLDKHNVECNQDEVITRFQLKRNSTHDKLRYEYKCCKMGSGSTDITADNNSGNSNSNNNSDNNSNNNSNNCLKNGDYCKDSPTSCCAGLQCGHYCYDPDEDVTGDTVD